MERLIKEAFLHVADLGPHVAAGQYDLLGPKDEIITPSIWESIIEPGWEITMHLWPIPEPPEGGAALAGRRADVVVVEPPGLPPPPPGGKNVDGVPELSVTPDPGARKTAAGVGSIPLPTRVSSDPRETGDSIQDIESSTGSRPK